MTVTPVPSAMPTMRLLCPAKINLHLRVGPRREDGFHSLLSWMCTVGLFDTLTLGFGGSGRESADLSGAPAAGRPAADESPAGARRPGRKTAPPGETGKLAGAGAVRLALECEPAGLPCDERNLVVRVAAAWDAPVEARLRGTLVKRIPVGAGLGGGSSDAARMILALEELFPGGAGGPADAPGGGGELSTFAGRFGSDLPFFLSSPSCVCAGRGEVVRPVPRPRPRWALLVLPDLMMPTPDVYRQFDAMGLGDEQDVRREPDWAAWAALDALTLLPRLVNDLERAAFSLRPDLGALRERVEETLSRPVRMSGSGSSLFSLFDSEEQARSAADRIGGAMEKSALPRGRCEAVELGPAIRDDLADRTG